MNPSQSVFEPLQTLTARALDLPGANIDTDQIIPARFLKKNRAAGYGQYLFFDERFEDRLEDGFEERLDSHCTARADHPLNAKDSPQFLVVQDNFGCGSSREGAVYALVDYGIRVVVGTSFGDIFFNNCFKNGLLPIRLPLADHLALRTDLSPFGSLTMDLVNQCVQGSGHRASFDIDPFAKACLLQGVDEVALTLGYEAQISAFENSYSQRFPWLTPPVA